jgi:hypothetical protein
MGDWKNDRAEAEMQKAEKEMMAKSVEKFKADENAKWDKIKESLYVGDRTTDDDIDYVIDRLKEKYLLPILK